MSELKLRPPSDQWNDSEEGEAVFTFEEDQVGTEGVGGGEHDGGAVGDKFAPIGTLRIGDESGDEAKGAAAGIGADEKQVRSALMVSCKAESGMVVDVVFVIVFTRGDPLEFAERVGGGEEADFAGGVAVHDEEEIGAAARAFDVDAKTFVGFFVEELVCAGGVTEGMAKESVGAFGEGIFDDVEKMAVVGGPGGGGDAFDAEGQEFGGAEIFDLEGVLAEAGGVGRVGEEMVVVGDFEGAEAEEGVALGEDV